MGQAPKTGAVSLRTANRNFEGRSGTRSAQVYLVSPEVAAVSALTGVLTNPAEFGDGIDLDIPQPKMFKVNDNMIIPPAASAGDVEVVRGPNIKPFPIGKKLEESVSAKVAIKVGDNITTDHIMPSNAELLPFRSNIPHLANYCLVPCDADFPARAREFKNSIIIAGDNYGQGSSREHAALVPLYLGVRAVVARSFARIHTANLINSGILPLTFENPADYDKLDIGDTIVIESGKIVEDGPITLVNTTKNIQIALNANLSGRQRKIMLAGGLLNYTKGDA